MTFFKNLKAELSALTLSLLAAWLVGVPFIWVVYGVTLFIPATVLVLYFEDMYRKSDYDRSLLTAQYYLGGVVLFAAIVSWWWAAMSTTVPEQGGRLGVTFFLSVLGVVWFDKAYKPSIQSKEERELARIEKYERSYERKWARLKKKVHKANKEEAIRYLSTHLVYHLVGDTLDGDVDFNQPIAVVKDEPMTYNQIAAMEEDVNGVIAAKRSAAYQYIQNLVLGKE